MQINLSSQTLHRRESLLVDKSSESLHRMIIISMMDEKGQRIGLGECAPLSSLSSDSDAYVRMSDVAEMINKAMASDDYSDMLRPYPALLFALESAMYDYQHNTLLYDTPFAHSQCGIPVCADIPLADYDIMMRNVKQSILQGCRSVKINISPATWDENIKLIDKIRSRFSKESLELRVDANGTFAVDDAMERIKELTKYNVHSIEQPIKQYQWKEMGVICYESPLPIVLDEELIGVNTLQEKQALLETIKPQYIAVRPMLHGGLSGSVEWISEANKLGIASWLSSSDEGNIGLRNIALLAARVYGPRIMQAQALDTGALYSDNIEMDIEYRNGKLWRCEVDE